MAVFCKIFMTFKTKFWGNDRKDLYLASDTKGKFSYWRPLQNDKGINLIFSVVTGDEAKRVERLDENDLKDEIMNFL